MSLGSFSFLFYAGLFLSVGEICNMVGVILAVPLSEKIGKKSTYMLSFVILILLSILFFYIPATHEGYYWMLILQVIISIFTGVVSPLVWSMYADVSDYAENRDGNASTGLIFSSASMAQKFGGAFGGFAVMWLLKAFNYNTVSGAIQSPEAINGLWLLMSWIPAAIACIAIIVVFFYPLNKKKMDDIQASLAIKRKEDKDNITQESGSEEVSSSLWLGLPKAMRWIMIVIAVIIVFELFFVIFC